MMEMLMNAEFDFIIEPRDGDWACQMDGRILAGRTPLGALHHAIMGIAWAGGWKG